MRRAIGGRPGRRIFLRSGRPPSRRPGAVYRSRVRGRYPKHRYSRGDGNDARHCQRGASLGPVSRGLGSRSADESDGVGRLPGSHGKLLDRESHRRCREGAVRFMAWARYGSRLDPVRSPLRLQSLMISDGQPLRKAGLAKWPLYRARIVPVPVPVPVHGSRHRAIETPCRTIAMRLSVGRMRLSRRPNRPSTSTIIPRRPLPCSHPKVRPRASSLSISDYRFAMKLFYSEMNRKKFLYVKPL